MFFYLFFIVLAKLLDIMSTLMLIRAVLSWIIQPGSENRFVMVLVAMTEIVVAPVRSFLDRFEFVHRVPLDISFLVAFLFVGMLSSGCMVIANLLV